MATTTFENKDTQYAHNSINEFFDNYGFVCAVQQMESVLKFALGHKVWKKEEPNDLLYFMEQLEELCKAAFMLRSYHARREDAILEHPLNGDPDMLQQQRFVGRNVRGSLWSHFPRSLSARQYHNPYEAVKKFVDCMTEAEWKKVFKEFTEYALASRPMETDSYDWNILTLRKRLLQLIEACHLLDLRTNYTPEVKPAKNK